MKPLQQIIAERDELNRQIENYPKSKIEDATKWLQDLLPNLTDKLENGNIVWLNEKNEWMFEQDYENGLLRYSYYRVWEILKSNYSLEHEQIHQLITDVVAKAFKCEQLTPKYGVLITVTTVAKAFKCEQLTPQDTIIVFRKCLQIQK